MLVGGGQTEKKDNKVDFNLSMDMCGYIIEYNHIIGLFFM